MRFRDQDVWVRVDDAGRPVLDRDGRAEMKYRQDDPRSYRPSPDNLASGGTESTAGAAGRQGAEVDSVVKRPTRPRAGTTRARSPGSPTGDDKRAIHVWTDGACTGNPGPMGIGVVVLADGGRQELGEYLGQGTNNIAELVAIERGLAMAAQLAPELDRPVRVYSDSAYSIGVVSMDWKAKANQELVARLRELAARFPDLTFVKVAGHAGVPENERCDELARRAIETRGESATNPEASHERSVHQLPT